MNAPPRPFAATCRRISDLSKVGVAVNSTTSHSAAFDRNQRMFSRRGCGAAGEEERNMEKL